jgi:DNA-binding response OmpR family regulator
MESHKMNEKRILIIDDDPSIRKFLGVNLIARGYQVLEAENGPLALSLLKIEKVNLILLDIMMPEMDGFEVCRQIRLTSQVPIIMLSAREGEMDSQKCLTFGANEYITKPFVLKDALKIIQEMIQ